MGAFKKEDDALKALGTLAVVRNPNAGDARSGA